MRNLLIISMLFLGYVDPPDSVNVDSVKVTVQARNVEMKHDVDTIKIMIKQLKDAINKANGDSIADGLQPDLLCP
jgi:hypothetical protein